MSDVWSGPSRPRISLFGSKWRFYLVLAIAAVVPLVIFLAASHWLLRRIAINNLLGQSQRAASTAGKTIEDNLQERRFAVQNLASDPATVALWTRGDVSRLTELMHQANELRPQAVFWGIYDSKGFLRGGYPQSAGEPDKSYASVDWFTSALDTGNAQVITNSTAPGKTAQVAISIAAPLACERCGVLTATYTPQSLKEWLTPMEVGATNWISIVDRNGIVLVAPGRDPSLYLRDVSQHQAVRDALQGKSGTDFVLQEGKRVLVSRHPLPSLGWAVLVEIPVEAIDKELWAYEWPLGILALFFDVVAVAIAAVIASLYRRLKQSREHVQQILTASQDAFVSTDERGLITAWNPQAEVHFGYSAAEALGKPVHLMITPPRYRDAQFRAIQKLLTVGTKVDSNKRIELTALHRSGREFPVELSISQVKGPRKNTLNAFIRDISQRRETLRQSEERFERVFRSSPLAITISTEKDGNYVDANDAFLKLVGYSRDELLNKSSQQLRIWINPEDREKMLSQLTNSRPLEPLETRFRTKSGEEREVLISAERITLDGIPCVLANTLDVTDSRLLEAQFRQAQKMEAVGRLAGGVAHDFNNLLGVIMGYSELATELVTPATPISRHLDNIKQAGRKAAALTKQLLAFSRQQVVIPQILNLNVVVNNTSKMLLRLIGEDVSLVLKPADSLGSVKADTGQIEQVLMNLVVNARDAMPGGGKIVIETANVELDETYTDKHSPVRPGLYVLLSVSDTGSGMDATTISKIFEPFFTTKEPGKGTGLGLSTVYGIVKQSGGYVWAYSELGRGSTFKIYLPRVDAAPQASAPEQPAVELARGTETVLLVEDDELLRELTANLLRSGGYTVEEAADANSALEIVKRSGSSVQLVLTDVIMPGMSGGELIARLRAIQPGLAVLFMSGYASDLIAHAGIAEPEKLLIQKPFTKRTLLTQVRRVLDESAGK